MDVYAHAATYAAIVLPVPHVLLAFLAVLVVQLHAQYADATNVYAALNVILSHVNAVQNVQVILVNVAQYVNPIHADAVLFAIVVLVYVVVNVVHAVAVQDLVLLSVIILVANKKRQGIALLLIEAFEIEFKYLIFFLELHLM